MDVWPARHWVRLGQACSLAENAPGDSEFLLTPTFRSVGTGTCPASAGTCGLVFTGRFSGFRTLFCVASSRPISSEHRARSNYGADTRIERSNEGRTCPDAEHSALYSARRESVGRDGLLRCKGDEIRASGEAASRS